MKKVILILLIFFSCYFIYNFTNDDRLFYLNIGDGLSMGINSNNARSEGYASRIKNYLDKEDKLDGYNDSFVSKDNRITDVLRSIKYHEDVLINDDNVTINELLKKADIVTISLGMNELYYKLLLNNDNMYGYVDDMLKDMDDLLKEIDRFNHKKVFVLGYYNFTGSNYDIFTYLNFNLEKAVNKYNYVFIDLDKLFRNNQDFFKKNTIIYPNNEGYERIFKIIVDKI